MEHKEKSKDTDTSKAIVRQDKKKYMPKGKNQ